MAVCVSVLINKIFIHLFIHSLFLYFHNPVELHLILKETGKQTRGNRQAGHQRQQTALWLRARYGRSIKATFVKVRVRSHITDSSSAKYVSRTRTGGLRVSPRAVQKHRHWLTDWAIGVNASGVAGRAYSKEYFGVHNFKSSCMM